jgi:hypothetical protein
VAAGIMCPECLPFSILIIACQLMTLIPYNTRPIM